MVPCSLQFLACKIQNDEHLSFSSRCMEQQNQNLFVVRSLWSSTEQTSGTPDTAEIPHCRSKHNDPGTLNQSLTFSGFSIGLFSPTPKWLKTQNSHPAHNKASSSKMDHQAQRKLLLCSWRTSPAVFVSAERCLTWSHFQQVTIRKSHVHASIPLTCVTCVTSQSRFRLQRPPPPTFSRLYLKSNKRADLLKSLFQRTKPQPKKASSPLAKA